MNSRNQNSPHVKSAPQPEEELERAFTCEELAAIHGPATQTESADMDRRGLLRGMGIAAVMASVGMASTNLPKVEAQESETTSTMRRAPGSRAPSTTTAAEALPALEIIALNRMAFGPRPGDLSAFLGLGATPDERLTAYVEEQLNPESINDQACDAILSQQGYLTMDLNLQQTWQAYVRREGDANKDNDIYLPAKEVQKAAFLRAIHSERQLAEVLADFWHNHFNVYAWNRWEGPSFRLYDRDVIRKNMLGNFREMIEDVAKAPAMLYYLDNQSNSGGDPNENFAREIFELHTMGAENYLGVIDSLDPANHDRIYDENGDPIGYIDDWVYGATTCFTGWQVNNDTGNFEFNESAHFPFQKVVLGKTLPAFQKEKDGHDVLDLLANHPGTARHIARRLCIRLISDTPPESIVQAAADVFTANIDAPDQLKKVVRTILLSTEFKTTWGEKIKRPFEYAVSLMRATQYEFDTERNFFYRYDPAGQPLYSWPSPDGFPDEKERWLGTMSYLQRMRLCSYLMEWKHGEDKDKKYRFRPEEQTPSALKTPRQLVDFWSNRLLGRPLSTTESNAITSFIAFGRSWDQELPEDDIVERLRFMIGLILMSSPFMLR